MDSLLDSLWEKIAAAAISLADFFDALLTPFHFLGPAGIIFLLALVTVFITKSLNRIIITKRFVRLEKKFKQLYDLRKAAMACEDREKGGRMARNIDKAELNRAYYDYFFEGFLLGLARKAIPIFIMFGYINEYFKPERLSELFGGEYILQFNSSGSDPVLIGSAAWYFISLLLVYLAWFLVRTALGRLKKNNSLKDRPLASEKA